MDSFSLVWHLSEINFLINRTSFTIFDLVLKFLSSNLFQFLLQNVYPPCHEIDRIPTLECPHPVLLSRVQSFSPTDLVQYYANNGSLNDIRVFFVHSQLNEVTLLRHSDQWILEPE